MFHIQTDVHMKTNAQKIEPVKYINRSKHLESWVMFQSFLILTQSSIVRNCLMESCKRWQRVNKVNKNSARDIEPSYIQKYTSIIKRLLYIRSRFLSFQSHKKFGGQIQKIVREKLLIKNANSRIRQTLGFTIILKISYEKYKNAEGIMHLLKRVDAKSPTEI